MEFIQKAKKHKKKLIFILIAIILAIIGFSFLSPEEEQEEEKQASAVPVSVLDLASQEAQEAELEKTVILSSEASAIALAEYSGRISQVKFELGDTVKKGQVLAVFDQSSIENAPRLAFEKSQYSLSVTQDNYHQTYDLTRESLEIAKNARKLAELQLENAKDAYDDNPTEVNENAVEIAKRSLENAEDAEDQAEESAKLQMNSAKLSVAQAESGVEQSRITYQNTFIKAPISGQITAKNVEQEAYLNAGLVVAQVVGEGNVQGTLSLNDFQAKRVAVGQPVELEISGESYPGKIVSVSPIASGNNQRFDVKFESLGNLAKFANESARVNLRLELTEASDSFFVPLEAVNIGQRKTVVYVAQDGKAVAREVSVGQVVEKKIEIISGLERDDQVIVENARSLRDGELIQIR